jgi:hypothetical protein
MRLHHRLSRLEQRAPDHGCPGCRDRRSRSVLVVADRLVDGSGVLRGQESAACAQCGVVPENVVDGEESPVEKHPSQGNRDGRRVPGDAPAGPRET